MQPNSTLESPAMGHNPSWRKLQTDFSPQGEGEDQVMAWCTGRTEHNEMRKSYQSTSKGHANLLHNLIQSTRDTTTPFVPVNIVVVCRILL